MTDWKHRVGKLLRFLTCVIVFVVTPAFYSAVFNSRHWAEVQMLQVRLSWLSTEQAGWYVYAIDFVLAGLLSALLCAALCLTTRIPAKLSAAIVALSVLFGFRPWLMLDAVQGKMPEALLEHVALASAAFMFGWLGAALMARRIGKRHEARLKSAGRDLTPPSG